MLRGVHEIDVDLRRSEGQRKYADFEIWLRRDQLLKRFALLDEIAQVDRELQELEKPTVVSVSEQKTEEVPETEVQAEIEALCLSEWREFISKMEMRDQHQGREH